MRLDQLRVKIYADCGSSKDFSDAANNPLVKGFTTNPALLRKGGVTDYEAFIRSEAFLVAPFPVSVEVFADDWDGMAMQARTIASWGQQFWVKIPVTSTKGEGTADLVRALAGEGVRINVTAVFTDEQIVAMAHALSGRCGIISIFAGRIADLGEDPAETIRFARNYATDDVEILWASPREVLNIWQADAAGADIITCGPDILRKLAFTGKSRQEFSLETVRMFHDDALAAGYQINDPKSYGGGGYGFG